MKRIQHRTILCAVAIAATQIAHADSVSLNGRKMSGDVRTINGCQYVPLSDVAKSLGMTVSKKNGGYVLIAAGGANAIRGKVSGKSTTSCSPVSGNSKPAA